MMKKRLLFLLCISYLLLTLCASACAAPSVFSGLIPAGEALGTLRLVPVGKAEMEEWSALTVYFSDYEKME